MLDMCGGVCRAFRIVTSSLPVCVMTVMCAVLMLLTSARVVPAWRGLWLTQGVWVMKHSWLLKMWFETPLSSSAMSLSSSSLCTGPRIEKLVLISPFVFLIVLIVMT
jgi:hypothetical protein